MPSYALEYADGAFCVRFDTGQPVPIRRGGRPVGTFLAGWNPVRLYSGAGNTRCLLLRREDGKEAAWYLNRDLEFVTNELAKLPAGELEAVRQAGQADLARLWDELLCSPAPRLASAELALDPQTRAALAREPAPPGRDDAAIILDAADRGSVELGANRGGIPFERVRTLLQSDYLALATAALGSGKLTIASPFTGEPLSTDAALHLRPGVYAYRFIGPGDAVFYLLTAAWRTKFLALYLPAQHLVVYGRPLDRQWLLEWLGQPLRQVIVEHLGQYCDQIVDYLAAATRRFGLVYHQEHLGHHLWNELTGLDAVLRKLEPQHIPPVFMLDAASSEMWGRLDSIFPALRDKVDRSVRGGGQLLPLAYGLHVTLLRPCDNFVSQALARRIIEIKEPEATGAAEEYARLRDAGFRIVMLGLRVENRTLVDLPEFCRALVEFMRQRVPRLAVVVDGHNASDTAPDRIYRSHGQRNATRAPHEVELDILADLRERFAGLPDVRILDTIGAPIGASLFWCNRSELFVTPWGAGLAKYRWVCNRPGVITAGPTFLRHSGADTVHLYDSDKFMERPTAVKFTTPDDAEDAPGAPMLVGLPTRDRMNYRLRFDAAFALVAELLEQDGPSAPG